MAEGARGEKKMSSPDLLLCVSHLVSFCTCIEHVRLTRLPRAGLRVRRDCGGVDFATGDVF